MMLNVNYNPDVLSCLANLSSDEVFTPPHIANQMLDLLSDELWQNSETTFLDPACKSGVFLREITKRLMQGLKAKIPDIYQRANHILTKQVFGIGITEMTAMLSRRSVYCSKRANGDFSIASALQDEEGNIIFPSVEHEWVSGKCKFCGASKLNYARESSLETHAYAFIHGFKYFQEKNMKFDVIIGNPPYQMGDGGFGKSAAPIYQLFVSQAKKLNPSYISMIIPARWYAGGKGLDAFRKDMLTDCHMKKLVDFKTSSDVFPGVDIAGGVAYFLWEKAHKGLCEVVSMNNSCTTSEHRKLDEFEIFIRDSSAIEIIRKIKSIEGNNTLNNRISPRKPFNLPTNYSPKESGVRCFFTQRIGMAFADEKDVKDNSNLIDKWKVVVPFAPIAGQTDFSKAIKFYHEANTRILEPGVCCTETWLVAGAFVTEKEATSFRSYLFTKTLRYLLLQAVVSQHVTRQNFIFVPDIVDYKTEIDDEDLRKRWQLSESEWKTIDDAIS